jgi:hypothetical protein
MRNGEVVPVAYACERNARDLEECFGTSDPKELRTVLKLLREHGHLITAAPGHLTGRVRVPGEVFPARMYVIAHCASAGDVRSLCRKLRFDARHEGRPRRMRAFTF